MDEVTPLTNQLGQKLAELRAWRGLSQRVVGELAGVSQQYVSLVESGREQVDKRSTLEALAQALRVSPVELGALPAAPVLAKANPALSAALGGLDDIDAALTEITLGESVGPGRPVPVLLAECERLTNVLRPTADYVGQVQVVPGLIRDLNTAVSLDAGPRDRLLVALMHTYYVAAMLTKTLRVRGLPAIAAMHARTVAEELDQPGWLGMADYLRAQTLNSSRARTRELAMAAAERLSPNLGAEGALEVYGTLHLTAAMAAAAVNDGAGSLHHLSEADSAAAHIPDDDTPIRHGFGNLHFSATNARFWRTAVAVELGDHGRVAEIATGLVPDRVPSQARRSAYWADVGRGLSHDKGTRDEAVEALLRAEKLAGVRLASDVYVRSTVTDLLHRVRRDSTAGRELRGLAYRMGVAAA